MKVQDIQDLLKSVRLNSKGDHLISDCPFCGKEGHFYLNIFKVFQKEGHRYRNSWDCKKCDESGNVAKLLAKLKKLSLLEEGKYSDLSKPLKTKLADMDLGEPELALDLPIQRLPFGFKRVSFDPYLKSRGFSPHEYEKYMLGRTTLPSLRDYVIVSVDEASHSRGHICRSTRSAEEIDAINDEYRKANSKQKYLRWKNSANMDKAKMLLGYDEIMFTTQWVALVEGFFDKVRVDQALGLDLSDDIKCCSTLGKSISIEQVRKLQRRGITRVIIVQDPDTIKGSKRLGFHLKEEFEEVLIGYTGSKDLGASSYSEVLKVFDTLKKPQEFSLGIVNSRLLR